MSTGRAFRLLLLIFVATGMLSACSNTKTDLVDTSKPASYEEYKQWRERFDPQASEYAEFKAWEEAYQRWKRQQAK